MDTGRAPERITLDNEKLALFCRTWLITELALFGSVLRYDYGAASDVDVLVTFASDAPWSLWDFPAMRSQLARLLGRRVDLVEKKAIRNPFVRREVLATQVVIYAA
jgi:predicted nucleotidyltransferase